jgi:hypothetical protein
VKDLTGQEVRVFLRGADTGDKPESTAISIAGASYATTAKAVTRASGSFLTDGVLVGMLIVNADFPDGTVALAVSALSITTNNAPTANGSSVSVRIWGGILATAVDAANGKVNVAGVGVLLNLGTAAADVYSGRASVRNTSTNKVGWTNDTVSKIEFRAVAA